MSRAFKTLLPVILLIGFLFTFSLMASAESDVAIFGNAKFTYDTEEKHLTLEPNVISGWMELGLSTAAVDTNGTERTVADFLNTNDGDEASPVIRKSAVRKVTVKSFHKFQIRANLYCLFDGMTALEEVAFNKNLRIQPNQTQGAVGLFKGCTSLTTVYFGDCVNPGAVDLTYWGDNRDDGFHNTGFKNMFSGCTSVTKVIFPAFDVATAGKNGVANPNPKLWESTFEGCTSLTSLEVAGTNFEIESNDILADSPIEEIIAEEGSALYQLAVDLGLITVSTIDTATFGNAKFTFDKETKELTIGFADGISGWRELSIGTDVLDAETGARTVSDYLGTSDGAVIRKADIKKVTVNDFSKFQIRANLYCLFDGMTSLEEVAFKKGLRIQSNQTQGEVGLFKGCTSLKTVYFGTCVNPEAVDFTYLGDDKADGIHDTNFKNMFSDCTSITKVILPTLNISASATGKSQKIWKSTFEGCTALQNVELLSDSVVIEAGAFADCTALRSVTIKNQAFLDSEEKCFPDALGLRIFVESAASAASVNGNNYTHTRAIYLDSIDFRGYSIRMNTYNGLRTIYDVDTENVKSLSNAGFELMEAGAILVSKNKLDNAGVTGVKVVNNGSSYGVDVKGAVIKPIYSGVDAEGNVILADDAKLLTDTFDNNPGLADTEGYVYNPNTTHFALSLINFTSNYTSDVYSVGYAVYCDKVTGKEYIEYADCEALKYTNIYDLAMALLTENHGGIQSNELDEKAVWNILYQGAAELDGISREINISGTMGILSKSNEDGNYYLFVRNEDGTAPSDTSAIEEAVANLNLGYTVGAVIPLRVKDTPDFECKSEWESYIDEKIASVPEGKSFIYFTDTHWVSESEERGDGFITRYVSYAKDQLDKENPNKSTTVIHGGDLYRDFGISYNRIDGSDTTAADTAEALMNTYMGGQLAEAFGGDFLYSVGNHEGNLAGWNTVADKSSADINDYIVSDKALYDSTVKYIADNNSDIVFDTEGIAAIRKLFAEEGRTEAEQDAAEYMMKLHYHCDDTENKIRYIVLDTGANGMTQTNVLGYGYDGGIVTQYSWFAKILKSTPADYDVVIAGHELVDINIITDTTN